MDRYIITSSRSTKRARQDDENVDDPAVEKSFTPPEQKVSDKFSKFDYLYGKFYLLVSTTGEKLLASCVNCHKTISASTKSSGNLLSHIKKQHPSLLSKVENERNGKNAYTIQTKLLDVRPKKVTKDMVKALVFDYIVDEMRPLRTCEKQSFKNLIVGLTGSDTIIPTRKQLSKQLDCKYETYVSMLSDLIKKHDYICVTADIWSTNNRSYMGMTCHFIDEETYVRHSYVIGCKRIQGSHNYQNITEVISKITQTYNIDLSKITHIVTDNASNFGKAFRMYSTSSNITPKASTSSDLGDFDEHSSESSNFDSDSDCLNLDLECVELNDLLLTSESNLRLGNKNNVCLPKHMLCCAHTINLIASSDISKISDENYIKISKSTFNKLSKFWNIASRSTTASDIIYDTCKCKFPVPVVTRWNSLYDATQKILDHKLNIGILFERLHLPKLKNKEWQFVNEYCKVMKPLAFSLDKLQSEKISFLGFVAPTILVLRKLLIQFEELIYCKPLRQKIISSLEKRFNFLFDLSDPKSKDFILASMSHPKFKLNWVPVRYKDLCKNIFIDECNFMTTSTITKSDSTDDESDDTTSDKEFYSNLYVQNSINHSSEYISDEIDSRQNSLTSVQVFKFFNSKKKKRN